MPFRDKDELHARMEELQQRRNASLSSSMLKAAQGDEERPKVKKARDLRVKLIRFKARKAKGFLGSLRNQQEPAVSPVPEDRRSQRTHKTSSFDSAHDLLPDGAAAALA